jgi:hypothetical protein
MDDMDANGCVVEGVPVVGCEVNDCPDTDDSERRLFGRRYRSGSCLTGDEAVGGLKVWLEVVVKTVERGRAIPEPTWAGPVRAKSSFDPGF